VTYRPSPRRSSNGQSDKCSLPSRGNSLLQLNKRPLCRSRWTAKLRRCLLRRIKPTYGEMDSAVLKQKGSLTGIGWVAYVRSRMIILRQGFHRQK
jgi:hypothetical protein